MKGFLAVIAITSMCVLSGCASDGTTASYEGYSPANQGNPASGAGAGTIAPITGFIG